MKQINLEVSRTKYTSPFQNWVLSFQAVYLSLLCARSSLLRLTSSPMADGNLVSELSLRYKAVRWVNFHTDGLTFRIVPVISSSHQLVSLPAATSSWNEQKYFFYILRNVKLDWSNTLNSRKKRNQFWKS